MIESNFKKAKAKALAKIAAQKVLFNKHRKEIRDKYLGKFVGYGDDALYTADSLKEILQKMHGVQGYIEEVVD